MDDSFDKPTAFLLFNITLHFNCLASVFTDGIKNLDLPRSKFMGISHSRIIVMLDQPTLDITAVSNIIAVMTFGIKYVDIIHRQNIKKKATQKLCGFSCSPFRT